MAFLLLVPRGAIGILEMERRMSLRINLWILQCPVIIYSVDGIGSLKGVGNRAGIDAEGMPIIYRIVEFRLESLL